MQIRRIVGAALAVSFASIGAVPVRGESLTFDGADAAQAWTLSGDAGVDLAKDRSAAPASGALRLGPGSKAVLPLRDADGSGVVDVWVFEDGAAPANAKAHGAGAMWGLMQADGHMAAVGAIYAPYLSGAQTYAISHVNLDKRKPWHEVQYLGVKRGTGWHRWTFDFDPERGLRLLYDGKDLNDKREVFNWNKSKLNGFNRLVLFGDATDAKQTLWADDVTVTLGPPAKVATLWPPPPPTPPADLTVLPPQAPWNPTPYGRWKNGPGKSEDYFPIAVWLQDPKLAPRYKAAGISVYLGLWKGPTQEQMDALREADMPVICDFNDYARAHLDEPLFVGWHHGDEPDNAQKFATYWNSDKETIKEGWPEIYEKLGLATREYKAYGPPVPPKWIVRDYEKARSEDPTRPISLGLGQGVAWEAYRGRGERTGRLDDYPEYIQGCDIPMYDIYPAAHDHLDVKDALWYVARGVRRLREWCGDQKPVWVHIETGIISAPESQPTPQQVRAEVWMALIHGARGVDYFVHQFKPKSNAHALLDNPAMLAMVTSVNQQIAKLARVLNSPTIADGASVASANPRTPVHAMVKNKDGATYVFSVAMYSEATKADFRVKGLEGEAVAEVLGEDRTVPVRDGAFSDAFDGNGVHLYKIAH